MKSFIRDTIREVMKCDQFTNNIDNPTEKREKNIKWAVEQIMDRIAVELNPIISKLKKIKKG